MIFALKDKRSIQVISIFAPKITDLPELCWGPPLPSDCGRHISMFPQLREMARADEEITGMLFPRGAAAQRAELYTDPLTKVGIVTYVQGDTSGCAKPPVVVDIDLKLRFSIRSLF